MSFEQPPSFDNAPAEPSADPVIEVADAPPRENVYVNPVTGRSSEVNIEKDRVIGSGSNATVYKSTVHMGSHEKTLAYKEYKPYNPSVDSDIAPRPEVSRSIEAYTKLHELNLPVWPTYRANETSTGILMTMGNNKEWYCLPGNETQSSVPLNLRLPPLKKIAELPILLSNLFQNAAIATDNNLQLWGDSIMYLVNKENPSQVQYLYGDYDNVEIVPEIANSWSTSGVTRETLAASNIASVVTSMRAFLRNNVPNQLTRALYNREIRKSAVQAVQTTLRKKNGDGYSQREASAIVRNWEHTNQFEIPDNLA